MGVRLVIFCFSNSFEKDLNFERGALVHFPISKNGVFLKVIIVTILSQLNSPLIPHHLFNTCHYNCVI